MSLPHLTRDAFKHWLKDHALDQPVGIHRRACECPVANFLTHLGYQGVSVGATSYRYQMPRAPQITKNLPQWAQRFIDNVDEDGSPKSVTAGAALAALAVPASKVLY